MAAVFINNFSNIITLNLNDLFCDQTKCYAINKEGVIFKSDTDHPSLYGAMMINDLIIKEIEKIDLANNK